MKKILFIGIENFFVSSIKRSLQKAGKEVETLVSNTVLDVADKCEKHPDIHLVVLVGWILDTPIHPGLPNTTHLIPKIKDKLGEKVKIITAHSDDKINQRLMDAGCNVDIESIELTEHLIKIL